MHHLPSWRTVAYTFFLLLALYVLAIIFGWFDIFSYFDTFMHLLGGVFVGMLFLGLWGSLFPQEAYAHSAEALKIVFLGVSFGACVGVLWEFFEFILVALFQWNLQPSVADTLGDLLCDMIGACLVCVWFLYIKKRIARS